jgi:acyl-CoA thioesterase
VVEQSTAADFRADSAVERREDGSWGAVVKPDWSGPPGPNGGYVAALVLRAVRAEVSDAARRPRSLTIHYLRPPHDGEVAIAVTIERSGRTATACSARLFQDGRVMCIALCTLTEDFEAAASWSTPAPDVAPADALEPFDTGSMPPRIFGQLEMRPTFGAEPFSGAPEALTGGWIRSKHPCPLEPELIAMYTDAWWPASFPRLDHLVPAPTLDLTIHFRAAPPPGDRQQVLARFSSTTGTDGFFEEDGLLWSEGGVLLAQSRQLALLRPPPPG